MKDELYYEEYDNVAIMFATITNYDIASDATVDIERNILSILNRIICDFDETLLSKTGPLKLEKIKVSGWTYMVACGLDPGRTDSSASLNSGCSSPNQRTSLLSNGRRSWNTFNFSAYYFVLRWLHNYKMKKNTSHTLVHCRSGSEEPKEKSEIRSIEARTKTEQSTITERCLRLN